MKKPGHSDRRNGVYMQQDTHKYIQDKKKTNTSNLYLIIGIILLKKNTCLVKLIRKCSSETKRQQNARNLSINSKPSTLLSFSFPQSFKLFCTFLP